MKPGKRRARWILRAQAGDAEALNDLLQWMQGALYGFIRRLMDDEHAAQDVLQESLLKIATHLYWLREPACFPTWAFRIASRCAFQALRRNRRLPVTDLHEDNLPAVEQASVEAGPEIREQVPLLLEKLSPASRAVFELHYLQELTLREVADVLEISEGTVKSRLAYGLAILRRQCCSRS